MWITLISNWPIHYFPQPLLGGRGGASIRREARSGRRCEPNGRGSRPRRWDRQTRQNTTIRERLFPTIRVTDAAHPLFGQRLVVSTAGASRRIGWIGVV